MMLNLTTPQEFRPLVGTRRTELFAWVLAIIMLLASWFGPQVSGFGRFFTILLVVFFTLSAVLISFGNWVERHTYLTLGDTGIEFINGVRRIQIGWEEITEVRILPSSKGSKVVVYSGQGYIRFQTLMEIVSNITLMDTTIICVSDKDSPW
jgi:hypothetical protein